MTTSFRFITKEEYIEKQKKQDARRIDYSRMTYDKLRKVTSDATSAITRANQRGAGVGIVKQAHIPYGTPARYYI